VNLPLTFCANAMGAHLLLPADPGMPLASHSIASYSIDTRKLQPGALFFALPGESHDGHEHVAAAFSAGALAAVVTHAIDHPGAQLIVRDTLAALQQLARAARERWGEDGSRRVVGITGSAGKTTTKEAIATLLSTSLRTGRTSGNFNNHIGVPLSILNLAEDAQVAVLEIGMNHAGEIRDLAALAQPHIGVVTNVGTAHIESFDSIDGIARAKRELIEALPAEGIAVLNADDERVRRFAAIHPGRSILYGTRDGAELHATGVAWHAGGCEFTLEGAGRFQCPLPGRAGLMTALAALATARALGLDLADLKDAIAALEPPSMRLQRIERNGMVIWDDCYNSNPEAACMMLDLLAATPSTRRIAVLGEMRELGTWAEELHREVGRYAVQCEVSVLVGIRGAARYLVDAARLAGMSPAAVHFFEEPQAAGHFLKSLARPGDSILFKGSRGTRVEQALEEFLR
jgi:UDP-N-acetylmuramoyl-tripeptide--D-alanyl-D-alanine ligase